MACSAEHVFQLLQTLLGLKLKTEHQQHVFHDHLSKHHQCQQEHMKAAQQWLETVITDLKSCCMHVTGEAFVMAVCLHKHALQQLHHGAHAQRPKLQVRALTPSHRTTLVQANAELLSSCAWSEQLHRRT